MTSFEIEEIPFDSEIIRDYPDPTGRLNNWPAVYAITSRRDIYVGETGNALLRMTQHRRDPKKQHLDVARILLDDTFHRSACYDLESLLIQWFYSDGGYTVINANDGHRNEEYPGRADFQPRFREIFDDLRRRGLFQHSLREIENSDFFKLSPFKSLVPDQERAIVEILKALFDDIKAKKHKTLVVAGQPGTGKTVVGVSLIKTLRDIEASRGVDDAEQGSAISDFFARGYPKRLKGLRVGMVVPQQSLRTSIAKIFDRTPGLDRSMVLTAYDVGRAARPHDRAKDRKPYDVLIVDEAHRLNQRANQSSGSLNKAFTEINERLFGNDSTEHTQLDWIREQSEHTILLMDAEQSVRPADLPPEVVGEVVGEAKVSHHFFALKTQMRVKAGADYVGFVRDMLAGRNVERPDLGDYEFALFDDIGAMKKLIRKRDRSDGLARLAAGYAWTWESDPKKKGMKRVPLAERPYDIEIDGHRWRWNSADKDWINSPDALDEVGSIHTVQGYDLNYAGVIIGPDLRLDPMTGQIRFDRTQYRDRKGLENNRQRGIFYTDADFERYIKNVYAVLLTRGIRGTYVYVCDKPLREHLRAFIPSA
ncbi:DNA/RNA helicase domain-containing protein [Microbacterium sp. ZW T5_56]|uniref:DNA/RNA helicase domain-containing protein n=1 Tax=Microbacterium sp. ZW T5_56 TaxID=3378081 RepID=UPI003854F75F